MVGIGRRLEQAADEASHDDETHPDEEKPRRRHPGTRVVRVEKDEAEGTEQEDVAHVQLSELHGRTGEETGAQNADHHRRTPAQSQEHDEGKKHERNAEAHRFRRLQEEQTGGDGPGNCGNEVQRPTARSASPHEGAA